MTRGDASLLARRSGPVPADLAAVVAVVLLVNVTVFAPVVRETPLRVPFVLAFVLFVPGYVVVAALYPERDGSADQRPTDDHNAVRTGRFRPGISGVERVALSFGVSFVLVPALGFPLTQWYGGVRLVPVAVTLSAFTVLVTAVALARRWRVAEEKRFSVPYRPWLVAVRSKIRSPDDRADAVLTALLVTSILLAAGTVGFAAANLPQEDEFSSITLLADADGGELTADGLPTEMNAGEREELVVAVDNHEYRSAAYTLVVVEQSLETDGDESVIEEQRELERIELQLDHDETELLEYDLEPTLTGDVRIVWLLYVDEEPTDPSVEDAPYHVHLVLEVE